MPCSWMLLLTSYVTSFRANSLFMTQEKEYIFNNTYQSIRKEISPRCSLEGLMLKLKLQYFGHLM